VDVDDRRGMAELAGFVSALGHTRIGVVMRRTTMGPEHAPGPAHPIAADLDAIANPTIRGRLEAVAEAFPHAVRVEAGGRDAAAGAAAARALLDHPTAPTAILAQNDLLALGALQAVRERGLRVPEDVTVTGFDGIELPGLDRALTTVRQPLYERGRVAGELVTSLLRGERPESVVLPVELVRGETAGPPPAPPAG
ncbi:substrate-binding domain-containing protein, partial [Microbacterium sp. 13-71-7]|uniref:substrate-binding domain-containing protein n=1 Tax=Microbacterium sp. 13-71-7 TaxID=1970399 RepID=UPI0025E30A50